MLILDPNATRTVVLECDQEKDESEQTRFFIRPLSGSTYMKCKAEASRRGADYNDRVWMEFFHFECLKAGLVRWENFKIEATDGSVGDHPFSEEAIGDLPIGAMQELVEEIIEISKLTREQAKN